MTAPLILMMAGGTGGHVYPALAVAVELRDRGYRIEWVGTSRGLEDRVVPAAGILLHHLTGVNHSRRPDWVVLAVPPHPVEWLYRDLKAAGISVERVGDCVAPRRAHAAVVDGERVGAAV